MTFFAQQIRSVSVFLAIAIIVIFTCIPPSWAEFSNGQNKPIVAVIHCDYSPGSFLDKNVDMPSGFFVEIMDGVATRAGLQITYICKNGWSAIIQAIENLSGVC